MKASGLSSFLRFFFCAWLICGLATLAALAQEGALESTPPKDTTPEEIIKRFAAKETEFAKARDQYTYRQDVKVETSTGKRYDGEYHEVFDVMFDDKGKRIENVVFAPAVEPDQDLHVTGRFEDIRHRLPFVLTDGGLAGIQHSLRRPAAGRRIALLCLRHCAQEDRGQETLFSRAGLGRRPRFSDRQDLRQDSARHSHRKHGDQENLFPKFTTWRQQIDGQYWFPVYTKADDELHFKLEDVHISEIVKYEDYKRFGAKSKILYEGKEIPKGDQKTTPPPDDKKPQ